MNRFAPLFCAALLAGCGGGGGSSALSAGSASSAKTQMVKGTVTLSIPTQASSSTVRYPQFVSPNASSVTIAATAATGGSTSQTFDVSATSSACTAASNQRNCTLTFNAPVGSDTFSIVIYAGPNGSGTVLGQATNTTAVTSSGTAFNFAVAINGVIGLLVVNVVGSGGGTGSTVTEGSAGTATLSVTAFDPSGAQITGTAPYATPIQISLTPSDPEFTATPSTLTAPGQTSTLAYNGAPFNAAITTTLTLDLTIGSQVVTQTFAAVHQNLYVANAASDGYLPVYEPTPIGGGSVTEYRFGASGAATPIRTISGSGLYNPVALTEDASGNLYVLDNGIAGSRVPVVLVFGPTQSGNTTPSREITGLSTYTSGAPCNDITIDPSGQSIWIATDNTEILRYPITANGNATPTAVYSLPTSSAAGITFDQSSALYASSYLSAQLTYYPLTSIPASSGSLSPVATIGSTAWGNAWNSSTNPNGIQPTRVAFYQPQNGNDLPPDLLLLLPVPQQATANPSVTSFANNEVGFFNLGSGLLSGAVPTAIVTGSTSTPLGQQALAGFAVDAGGGVYVSNPFTNQIFVYTLSGTSATLSRTISGTGLFAPVGLFVGP